MLPGKYAGTHGQEAGQVLTVRIIGSDQHPKRSSAPERVYSFVFAEGPIAGAAKAADDPVHTGPAVECERTGYARRLLAPLDDEIRFV
ncbi:hypothetical protein DDE84_01205 [Bifidobacterium tibiigranuli]|uniref:Uncharacterized protein n=1 Tax=Bifidobacterium tibiigranuli TaxID=2172043 RepID=A0A5N6S6X3_9BIFI|nr:hypothetical protein DDE84_01205 [Bifidobacterium tibiigranuli]KAE8130416.1 hypothetical protein DDF78_00450 [Bifidobacterium tibiigranuli]